MAQDVIQQNGDGTGYSLRSARRYTEEQMTTLLEIATQFTLDQGLVRVGGKFIQPQNLHMHVEAGATAIILAERTDERLTGGGGSLVDGLGVSPY